MRRIDKLSSFQNIVAGQKATVNLPVDRNYHGLRIHYKKGGNAANRASMEADIKLIRLLIDGVVQWELTAKQLFALHVIKGYPVKTGVIPIHFSEPWRRSPQGEDLLSWSLAGSARTFQVEVDIAEGVTQPDLDCYCDYDNAAKALGVIRKITQQQIPVAGTGIHTLDQIPGIGNLQALYAFESTVGDIKHVRIELKQNVVYEAPRIIADELLISHGGEAVDDVFAVRFDRTERASNMLSNRVTTQTGGIARQPVRIDFDMKTASPFTALYEYVGPKNGG
ncbi:major capsid protein P2 [Pseudovibrio ascidiaceicola]|uniref:major capsid protein P2 n=1 Tax=Pseudovibrio ascidiaceicola TaxID=285279 RepID=UPI000D68828A|nr:major capsid protein P2 [Pseudovibrio ascidiaceicola]